MFCYQCEQNMGFRCFSQMGVCGKDERTAIMQDILLYAVQGLSFYSLHLKAAGQDTALYDAFVTDALFTTVTNVNFDADNIKDLYKKCIELRNEAALLAVNKTGLKNETNKIPDYTQIPYIENEDALNNVWKEVSIPNRRMRHGNIVTGLQELVLYGIKGMSAYLKHASIFAYDNDEIMFYVHKTISNIRSIMDSGLLLDEALRTGAMNLKAMELLDKAHTENFGHPEPVRLRTTPVKGKAILVSGHDLKDLYELLKQTEGKGINVYTHGEMLPAHGYPELAKFSHLVGNYGGAWQEQHSDFMNFPGAILMTTNCIQYPLDNYSGRMFTCGLVRWPGIKHIENRDFSEIIDSALNSSGFEYDYPEQFATTGFARNAVLSRTEEIINLVKSGDLKHFFLIGGCDGARPGRNYYTEMALNAPKDTVVMTLACGKYRFNKYEFGKIGELPRFMDIGQCNDAYSAVKIASALADEFGTDINSLPLTIVLSWYEQKAVAILLSLLHLGIKNIRLGPSFPAFIEPEVLQILIEKYNLMFNRSVEEDLDAAIHTV